MKGFDTTALTDSYSYYRSFAEIGLGTSLGSHLEREPERLYSKEHQYLTELHSYGNNWDNYGAFKPLTGSLITSEKLLKDLHDLKNSIPLNSYPEFLLAPDGIIGFEWDYTKDSRLFARVHSPEKIEYQITTNGKEQKEQTVNINQFTDVCKNIRSTYQAA